MDPKNPKITFDMLLTVWPAEILTPRTPGVSHGTKIFVSKFFSSYPLMMLFYAFCGLMWEKLVKNRKNMSIWPNFALISKMGQFDMFSLFFTNFSQHNSTKCIKHQFGNGKRKILRQKFWSHGTSLGSMGSLSQEDLGQRFYRLQFLVIWGPYELPVLVASHGTAKSLKAARSRCEPLTTFKKTTLPIFNTT